MKTIIFVTGNQVKIRHAQEALNQHELKVVQQKLELIEPREPDPAKVVVEKARQAFEQLKSPLMVEDSGIFIRALNGFPMGMVHFVLDTIGVENIIKMMEGVKDRHIEFRQSLAYIEPGMKVPKVFSYVDGNYLIAEKVWTAKYDCEEFDTILIPPSETKPLCMFSPEWKAKRDTKANQDTIHYRQLAKWLNEK